MSLIDLITNALWEGFENDPFTYGDRDDNYIETADQKLFDMKYVAGYVLTRLAENKMIETVEQLDKLPVPTANQLDRVLIKSIDTGKVYERNTNGTWCMLQDPSGSDWGERLVLSKDVSLPAVVLYVPSIKQEQS